MPECCKSCRWLEWDYDEYREQSMYYCLKGLYMPFKKRTCKRWLENLTLTSVQAMPNSPAREKDDG